MKKAFQKFAMVFMLFLSAVFANFLITTPTSATQQFVDTTPNILELLNSSNSTLETTPSEPDDNTPNESDNTNIHPGTGSPPGVLETIIQDSVLDGRTPVNQEDVTPTENPCRDAAKGLSWIICSAVEVTCGLVDSVYGAISDMLVIQPLSFTQAPVESTQNSTDNDNPGVARPTVDGPVTDTDTDSNADSSETAPKSIIYQIWSRIRDLTNIVFVIFVLIVIYSQVTGLGISNYGIKRVLPRIIISVLLVNLSYIICALALDISNVVGSSITTTFDNFQNTITLTEQQQVWQNYDWEDFAGWLTGGVALAGLSVVIAGGVKTLLWIVGIALIGAVISVIIGLITISLRQGVVSILVMISPLAFVAYLLPNTEKWFEKWKNLFFQMLFFYPMFSFLFAASKFAGWSIIVASGSNALGVFIGVALKILPLVLGISLLKMSNTILGKVSAGLEKAFTPLRNTISVWGDSHINQSRSRYLAGNHIYNGSRLRNYLAYRQTLRELDTNVNSDTYKNRALERAYKAQLSEGMTTKSGHTTWHSRPNSYTRAAKLAKLQSDRAATAQRKLDNTLSEYGEIFDGRAAHRLSGAHAEAFKDSMMQEFWAENIAQNDQSYLLDSYLKASTNRYKNPREYNRLILDAAGSLGHIGEATIMGQVIKKSVEIEARRRSEAAVMINKFGVDKPSFRGMVFDTASIDDNGFELDENGKVIEDKFHRIMPGHQHREWPNFIAVDKRGIEISSSEYAALSEAERKNYRKVRYMHIYDDDRNIVQTIYEDDAGYMKEMLTKDIAIGDPINVRYAYQFGLKRSDKDRTPLTANIDEQTGRLRKYHSTVASAYKLANYAEHDAAFTAMLVEQINNGYITSFGQLNIARLESIWKSAKTNKLVQNDPVILLQYKELLDSINHDIQNGDFDKYYGDDAIALYRNVNGLALHGARLVNTVDSQGNPTKKWVKIHRSDPTLTVEDQRNFLIHEVIPYTLKKVIGALDRNMSQTALDNLKPDGVRHLYDFVDNAKVTADRSRDAGLAFEQRINPNIDIFDNVDPAQIKNKIGQIKEDYGISRNNGSNHSSHNSSSGTSGQSSAGAGTGNYTHTNRINQHLNHTDRSNDDQQGSIDLSAARYEIWQQLLSIFDPDRTDFNNVCDEVLNLFRTNTVLQDYLPQITIIVKRCAESATSDMHDITHPDDTAKKKIATLKNEVETFVNTEVAELNS